MLLYTYDVLTMFKHTGGQGGHQPGSAAALLSSQQGGSDMGISAGYGMDAPMIGPQAMAGMAQQVRLRLTAAAVLCMTWASQLATAWMHP